MSVLQNIDKFLDVLLEKLQTITPNVYMIVRKCAHIIFELLMSKDTLTTASSDNRFLYLLVIILFYGVIANLASYSGF